MKNISRKTILAATAIAALAGALTLTAAETPNMRVDIPFAFVAGKTALPAGEYYVNVNPDTRVLRIQGLTTSGVHTMMLTSSTDKRRGPSIENGELRFVVQDGQYVLASVFSPSKDLGNRLPLKNVPTETTGVGGTKVNTVGVAAR